MKNLMSGLVTSEQELKGLMMNKLGAVILAAGKGKRMKSKASNKVTLQISGKPMILHALDLVKELNADPIIIVVGFAKESVKKIITENAMPARPAGGAARRAGR